MKKLSKYSIGMGDRFERSKSAQLKAVEQAWQEGIEVAPVWNKSHREHLTVNSFPVETARSVAQTIKDRNWQHDYFLDADHIRSANVTAFLPHCNFFTVDVANSIGIPATNDTVKRMMEQAYLHQLDGAHHIRGVDEPLIISQNEIEKLSGKYLLAIEEVGRTWRLIREKRKADDFVLEVSMDETSSAMNSLEFTFLLFLLAQEGVPVQTIAPKFTGRFNKGVDYSGDVKAFEKQFGEFLAIIRYAVHHWKLPANLKLSIHTGSDKFRLYPVMNRCIKQYNTGLHLKTAGTTWLEEVIGMAASGGEALDFVKTIYCEALNRQEELLKPYSEVIEVDPAELPSEDTARGFDADTWVATLEHNTEKSRYNPSARQLMHCAYKLAAERQQLFWKLRLECMRQIDQLVTANLFERHIKPLFG